METKEFWYAKACGVKSERWIDSSWIAAAETIDGD